MRKLTALLLACFICMSSACGAGVRVTLNAPASDILPEGAMRALETVFSSLSLTLQMQEETACVTVWDGDNALLQAQSADGNAYLGTDKASAPLPYGVRWEKIPEALPLVVRQLGEMLSGWEKTGASGVDLKNAGKPKTQSAYALTGEEWAALWPEVCGVLLPAVRLCLPDDAQYARAETYLRSFVIRGKGTLRRYFAAGGTEMGAYFYAAKAGAENDLREIRLEYGFVPDKGFYLAFRCPNEKETRNVRISMQGKTTVRNARTTQTISADVRISQDGEGDTYLLESTLHHENDQLTGKATLNMTHKRAGKTTKRTLTVEPKLSLKQDLVEGTAEFSIVTSGKTLLSGEISVTPCADGIPQLPPEGDRQEILNQLPYTILRLLRRAENSDMQQLLHYLARGNFLSGETTTLAYTERPDGLYKEEPEQ